MAKVKLEKILESMDSFKLNCEVSLLENEDINELTRAQTRKDLYENFNFIKKELIAGGLLEETQNLLRDTWTQAIMEDVYAPMLPEEEGMSASEMAALGAGALGTGAAAYRYGYTGAPTGAKVYNNVRDNGGSRMDAVAAGLRAAGTVNGAQFNQDLNTARGAYNTAAGATTNAYNTAADATKGAYNTAAAIPGQIKTGYKMGNTNEGLTKNIMNNGNTASKAGAIIGKTVRRAKNIFTK